MDPHQGAGLFDHDPGGGIGNGKNSLVSFSASGPEVILQTIGQLLGDEDHLSGFSTLGILDGKFLFIHIHGNELQDFANPHATPGHKFKHETVPRPGGPEDDLADDNLFVDLPLGLLSRSENLFQHGGVAGVPELCVQIVADEVKESLEIGVTGVFGELLTGIIEAGLERKHFLW